MSSALLGPLLAATIGSTFSLYEVFNVRGKMPPFGVCGWVLARIVVDGIISALLYPVAIQILSGAPWGWASLTAGVSAPVLLRSQCNVLGRGRVSRNIGPEAVYRMLRETCDSKIDRYTSTNEAGWLIHTAAPAVRLLAVDQVMGQNPKLLRTSAWDQRGPAQAGDSLLRRPNRRLECGRDAFI